MSCLLILAYDDASSFNSRFKITELLHSRKVHAFLISSEADIQQTEIILLSGVYITSIFL